MTSSECATAARSFKYLISSKSVRTQKVTSYFVIIPKDTERKISVHLVLRSLKS